MTFSLKHAFQSTKPDGADTSVVRPSDWNAEHQISGILPIANGGTGTTTTFTNGSIVYAGASGVYSQDNANLFYDATNIRVGIGTNSPSQRLELYHATAPLARFRNAGASWDVGIKTGNVWGVGLAGGSQAISVDTGGLVGLGQGAPQADLHVGSSNVTPVAAPAVLVAKQRTSGSGHAFADESFVDVATNGTGYAAFAASTNYTGTKHYDHFVAFQADVKYASTGTLTSAYGLTVGLHCNNGLWTNFYGSYIYNPPVTAPGSITNAYGHYVEDITSGTGTNYAVYTAGTTKSYFGGAVGFGADTINATFAPQLQIKKAVTDASNPAMSLILNRQASNTAGFLFGMDNSNNAAISINGSGDFRIGVNASGNTTFTENVRITSDANVKIGGTAQRGTTEGTKQLVLFNGTAPAGTLANGVSLYSTSGELRVMDAAGNATLLSPHDHDTNEWIYDSVDTTTGKRLRIDMERMMKAINDHFGWDFVKEFVE